MVKRLSAPRRAGLDRRSAVAARVPDRPMSPVAFARRDCEIPPADRECPRLPPHCATLLPLRNEHIAAHTQKAIELASHIENIGYRFAGNPSHWWIRR